MRKILVMGGIGFIGSINGTANKLGLAKRTKAKELRASTSVPYDDPIVEECWRNVNPIHPLVSVCIPMYNVELYIEETITRLKQQTYPNIEIVIVDDHSTDKSYLLARQFVSERIHLYRNPKKGGNAARNYAFQMSHGDYIKFLDADDCMTDELIEKQLKVLLESGTKSSLVYSPFKRLFSNGEIVMEERKTCMDYAPGIELLMAMRINSESNVIHSYLLSRELAVRVGDWDENIWRLQDTEYFARALSLSDKALFLPDEYAIYRMSDNGVHAHTTHKAILSVLEVYIREAKMVLAYKDSMDLRELYSVYYGNAVYRNYLELYFSLSEVTRKVKEAGLQLIFPTHRSFCICRRLFGWKVALFIIRGRDKLLGKYN